MGRNSHATTKGLVLMVAPWVFFISIFVSFFMFIVSAGPHLVVTSFLLSLVSLVMIKLTGRPVKSVLGAWLEVNLPWFFG